ncbi:MAG: cysteine synthase family protein [Clostridia bacterium]|nr:cysteine synthase family protein [Clostridia bacterium]
MGKIYENVLELIGHTPIVHLSKIEKETGAQASIYAKLESFNPGGSVKDRAALNMINEAEAEGLLSPGGTIVEGTSGNTGIGLAMIAAVRGYRAIICMSEDTDPVKIRILKAYGAEVELTPRSQGFGGGGGRARELAESIPGAFRPGQGENPNHPAAHFKWTGPEIWEDMDGKVDIFVASVGTGGTSRGTAEYLRTQNPDVVIVGVEPAGSPVLTAGEPGRHKIQGIGGGAICPITDRRLYNEVLRCPDDEAYRFARLCPKTEGILIGISAGAALWGAARVASRPENRGKNIVVLFPDGGSKYLWSDLYDDQDAQAEPEGSGTETEKE